MYQLYRGVLIGGEMHAFAAEVVRISSLKGPYDRAMAQ